MSTLSTRAAPAPLAPSLAAKPAGMGRQKADSAGFKQRGAKAGSKSGNQAAADQAWKRGVVLANQKDWAAAAENFRRATALAPRDALYWLNLANSLRHAGVLDEAEAAARETLARDPAQGLARQVLADCLAQMHRPQEALLVFEEMQAAGQTEAQSLTRHAATLLQLLRPHQAAPLLLQALALEPALMAAHALLADSMSDQGLKREAVECLKTVVALAPDFLEARVRLSYELRHVCNWNSLDVDVAAIAAMLQSGGSKVARHTAVFSSLSLPMPPELHLVAAASEARARTSHVRVLPAAAVGAVPARWRIGLLSFDFRDHPVSQLLVEVLEHIDRSQFEIYLYSYGPDDATPLRQRIERAADHFVDVREMSDHQAALRIREDGVALMFDLMGFTRGARPAILAHRPAPVQVGFLGFPGSSGAPYIDYLVGDEIVTPLALADLYSEKLAQMPRCFLPNGRWRPTPKPADVQAAATRQACGLPENAFVLCAFNQAYKILPAIFDAWCAVLHAVPHAVLWLNESNAQLRDNVLRQAALRGIEPQRLHFAQRVSYEAHFSRLALADIFVDTSPYNGHTTVADALWAGVPVVTLSGNAYASRVAASALDAMGLGELAFMDVEDYVTAVVALAQDSALLAGYRQHLAEQRLLAPLFDAGGYAQDLALLMQRMLQRWQAGLAPEHLPAQHAGETALMQPAG